FSPDGRLIATSRDESPKTVELRDTTDGRVVRSLKGHAKSVYGLAFSPSRGLIATASDDETIRIWDTTTGTASRVLRGHGAVVFGVTFSPDGCRIASIGLDGTVKTWDAATGRELGSFLGVVPNRNRVYAHPIAFNRCGRWIAAASDD